MFKHDLRRFAPFGLYLAGIAALVSAGLYIVFRAFDLPIQISLSAIIIGLALFILLDPQRAKEAITGRQARYGSNMIIMAVAFTGILVVLNYLAYNNSKQWDLTEDKLNTLAPETVTVLESLSEPVKVEAYFSSRLPIENARSLLENYKKNSDGKFDYELVDPETNPVRAQEAGVKRDGTIVLSLEDRKELVNFVDEQEISAALVRLTNPGERTVYFLTGHGEYPLDTSEENNYSEVRTALESKNYTVKTLNLLQDQAVPDDALTLIIAGPTKPVTEDEVAIIREYVNNGGSLVYLTEPDVITEFGDDFDPMQRYINEAWGIVIGENMVIDMSSQQPVISIAYPSGSHPITQKLGTMGLIMPSARSVFADITPQEIQLTSLAQTSNNSWGETDYESLKSGQVTLDQTIDFVGPVPVAVVGENFSNQSRVLVVGDSDFASSGAFTQLGNGDFLLNGIDWVAEQEGLINLTPKESTQRFLLPPQQTTLGLILLGSVFLLPGLVIATGVSIWLERRKRG